MSAKNDSLLQIEEKVRIYANSKYLDINVRWVLFISAEYIIFDLFYYLVFNMGKYLPQKGKFQENNLCLTALVIFKDISPY